MKKNCFLKIFSLLAVFTLFACKEIGEETVPYAYVNFTINIDRDPAFYALRASGGYVSVTGGALSNGIIIYRTGETFYAYDRTCPYDPEKGVVGVVKSNSIIAKDAVCGSEFSMPLGGQVQKGPCVRPLKQYQVSYNSLTGDIYVYN